MIILMVLITDKWSIRIIERIKLKIKDNNLEQRIRVIKHLEQESLAEIMSGCDYGLSKIHGGKDEDYSIPVKLYEYILCGVPPVLISRTSSCAASFLRNVIQEPLIFENFEDFLLNYPVIRDQKMILKTNRFDLTTEKNAEKLLRCIIDFLLTNK